MHTHTKEAHTYTYPDAARFTKLVRRSQADPHPTRSEMKHFRLTRTRTRGWGATKQYESDSL